MVEPRPVVFPSQSRREFHQLCRCEPLAQPGKQRVRNFDRSLRHAVGIFQHQLFGIREVQAGAVAGQRFDLLRGDAALSADRRPDINSKRTPDQSGDPQLRQFLQARTYQAAGDERLLHLTVAP